MYGGQVAKIAAAAAPPKWPVRSKKEITQQVQAAQADFQAEFDQQGHEAALEASKKHLEEERAAVLAELDSPKFRRASDPAHGLPHSSPDEAIRKLAEYDEELARRLRGLLDNPADRAIDGQPLTVGEVASSIESTDPVTDDNVAQTIIAAVKHELETRHVSDKIPNPLAQFDPDRGMMGPGPLSPEWDKLKERQRLLEDCLNPPANHEQLGHWERIDWEKRHEQEACPCLACAELRMPK